MVIFWFRHKREKNGAANEMERQKAGGVRDAGLIESIDDCWQIQKMGRAPSTSMPTQRIIYPIHL